jgi:hypothetical protein
MCPNELQTKNLNASLQRRDGNINNNNLILDNVMPGQMMAMLGPK